MSVDMGAAYMACGHLSIRGTFPALTYEYVQYRRSPPILTTGPVNAVGSHSQRHSRIHDIGF